MFYADARLNLARLQLKDAVHNLTSPSIPKREHKGSGKYTESDFYEDACANLLVKAIYNGGNGYTVSSNLRSRERSRPTFGDVDVLRAISSKSNTLTPDFCVTFRGKIDHTKEFANCLKPLTSDESPEITHRDDLSTPPTSPPPSVTDDLPSRSLTLVFEFTVDESLWESKMSKLESYLGYTLMSENKSAPTHASINEIVAMAGLAFPSAKKFAAIKNKLAQKKLPLPFPLLSALNSSGQFFYLVCADTFIKDTASEVSSNSQGLQRLETLVLMMANVLVSDIDDK